MKKAKRWQYYCDYCKKSGGHAGYMKIHEKYCTANPNRQCRMCDELQTVQQPLKELKEKLRQIIKKHPKFYQPYFDASDNEKIIDEFREVAQGCPACMLAAIRQSEDFGISLDYAKERDRFWAEINDANA